MIQGGERLAIRAEDVKRESSELDFYDFYFEVPSEKFIEVEPDTPRWDRYWTLKGLISEVMSGDITRKKAAIEQLTPHLKDALWKFIRET